MADVKVDNAEAVAMLEKIGTLIVPTLEKALDNSAKTIRIKESIKAPRGASNELSRSIEIDKSRLKRVIEPKAKHAVFVEYGTRPHFPPAYSGSPLALWAESKGIEPYAVAKSISQRGTRPHPFVEPVKRDAFSIVSREIERETVKMIERL